MNNDFFNAKDDGIGIDPTVMPKIESLDDVPNQNKNNKGRMPVKKTENKKGSLIKKILFTIVVLLLMAGVSFGLYYYLSLGTNAGSAVKLDDMEVFVGERLPTSVMEYGDFGKVDISKCTLNILDVNVNEIGSYNYSVLCGEVKYEAKIIVKEKIVFDIATKIVFKTVGDEIKAEDFISSKEEGYTFALATDVSNLTEGLHNIDINVKNPGGKETVVSALLYLNNKKTALILNCQNTSQTSSEYSIDVIDRFAFGENDQYMGVSTRSYLYKYTNESDYEKAKEMISSGKIKLDDHEGYALIDNVNFEIEVIKKITKDEIASGFNTTLSDGYRGINNYYRRTLGYSCSI